MVIDQFSAIKLNNNKFVFGTTDDPSPVWFRIHRAISLSLLLSATISRNDIDVPTWPWLASYRFTRCRSPLLIKERAWKSSAIRRNSIAVGLRAAAIVSRTKRRRMSEAICTSSRRGAKMSEETIVKQEIEQRWTKRKNIYIYIYIYNIL